MRSLALGINTSQMESAKTLRCNNAASSASPALGDRSQEIRLRLSAEWTARAKAKAAESVAYRWVAAGWMIALLAWPDGYQCWS